MEFQDVVDKRRMVRNYDPERPVPPEIRERILSNALHAPSAGFSQGWAFLTLEGDDIRTFWKAAVKDRGDDPWLQGLMNAPLLIIPLSHKQAYLDRYADSDKGWEDKDENRWPVPYWDIDTGFASLLMLLTAVDEGLGACFFGIPPGENTRKFRSAFGVPDSYTAIGVISIGYRAQDRPSPSLKRGRKPVEAVVHRGSWGNH
ncbi:nitroreductase family protein [Nonomuraea soli]|uniref:Nitroreductase n=1 Tax=Nonomuraea soli TaxID=1032476 RepID=A0A7W0CMV5_9ACTN|nr:nitroreductase family protein [Nonomuraea soli]MBA2894031.1 nitroreductase [Nonomuraea soli]